MNSTIVDTAPLPTSGELTGLEPIRQIRRRWPMLLSATVSLLMVAALGYELFDRGLAGLSKIAPSSWLFYIFFALFYLGPPTFDFIIFRKLWRIPASGMVALHRKRIANEVVLGYSGEAYFYAWARQRMQMVAAPFGAVKDVSILSAIAGNAITLGMLAMALPLAAGLLTPTLYNAAVVSVVVMIAMSVPFLIFSKRVFSLQRGTLWWIFGIHSVRLLLGSFLLACVWHFAMPEVSLGMWLILAASRMLVSRLPLVPNKDLLFASFAILLIGQGEALSELMAFVAALTLLVHVTLIAGFGFLGLVRKDL